MSEYKITLDEVKKWDEQSYEYLDVREESVVRLGKIPDALNIPLESLGLFLDKISNTKKQVVYCAKEFASAQAVDFLRKEGFEAYVLSGGYQEWLIEILEKEEEKNNKLPKIDDLEVTLSKLERNQYARQMILPGVDSDGQIKLKNAKVLVIGVGALGTIAATYLCEAGIGHIGLVEADVIDRSNLHRQMLYDVDSIGKKKGEIARKRLEQMNEFVDVTWIDDYATPENIDELVKGYDFVIDATDTIECKFLINDACVINKVAFCHAGILGFVGQVFTWTPESDVCYRCIFEDVPKDYVPTCAQAGVLGALSGMIGSTQALEAIKYVLGIGDLLTKRMMTVDALTMKIRLIAFPRKNSSCRVCGNAPDITDVKKYPSMYERKYCMIP